PTAGGDIRVRDFEAIAASDSFCLRDPTSELRNSRLIREPFGVAPLQLKSLVRFAGPLFDHQFLPTCRGLPIDMSLRFACNVGTHTSEVVAFQTRPRPTLLQSLRQLGQGTSALRLRINPTGAPEDNCERRSK